MTKNKRFSFMATPELEEKIIEMRKTDEFCRMTFSDIIRVLIERGVNVASDSLNTMETETA